MKGSQVKGRPKNISSLGFPSWVQQIDAAVHIHKTVHTLFFTQHQYWRWTIEDTRAISLISVSMNDTEYVFAHRYNEHNKTMNDSSPRNISDDFPEINGPISAVIYKDGRYQSDYNWSIIYITCIFSHLTFIHHYTFFRFSSFLCWLRCV